MACSGPAESVFYGVVYYMLQSMDLLFHFSVVRFYALFLLLFIRFIVLYLGIICIFFN